MFSNSNDIITEHTDLNANEKNRQIEKLAKNLLKINMNNNMIESEMASI